MGTEYTLRPAQPCNREEIDAYLRSLPHFANVDAAFETYDFRLPSGGDAMPDASVKIEPDGSIYVCDYGGALIVPLIGALVLHLARASDPAPVTVTLMS